MRILLPLLLVAAVAAESAPPQLDPTKPADAVQIVNLLTAKLELPRDQAVALTVAIETLARSVREHEAAKTQPLPTLDEPAAPPAKPKD